MLKKNSGDAVRAYTAGQVSEITGVSVSLQRHWRRRGLLPDIESGKHARFVPAEVIRMMIMKTLSDSNISIKGARIFTHIAACEALRALKTLSSSVAAVAEGDLRGELSDSEWTRVSFWFGEPPVRYIFLPLPEGVNSLGQLHIFRFESLSKLAALQSESSILGLVIDVELIARAFLARAS